MGLSKGFPEAVRFGLRANWGVAMGEQHTGCRVLREKGARGVGELTGQCGHRAVIKRTRGRI